MRLGWHCCRFVNGCWDFVDLLARINSKGIISMINPSETNTLKQGGAIRLLA
jgi:hypothetical protein